MLSHEDQRRLAAIEQELMTDDPPLARRFARHRSVRRQARRILVYVFGALYVFVTTIAFVPGPLVMVALLSALLTAALCYVIRKMWPRPR